MSCDTNDRTITGIAEWFRARKVGLLLRRVGIAGLFVVCLFLASCPTEREASRGITPYDLSSTEEVAVRSINDFGFRVFSELASIDRQQNIVMSPVGLCMALGMALSGAEGGTQESIRVALGLIGSLSGSGDGRLRCIGETGDGT